MGFLPYVLAGGMLGAVFIFPAQAADAAREGLSMWAGSVAPGLGPGMALSSYLCSRAKGEIFRVAASVLCGSPGGAKLMSGQGKGKGGAMRDAALCGVMSPLFFLGAVAGWLGDKGAAWLVYICHLAGAFLTAMCFPKEKGKKRESAPPSFLQCTDQSVQALLNVAFLLMLGCVGARMMQCALPGLGKGLAAGLQCVMEVTGGVKRLIGLGPENMLPFVCGAVSFGGLSILMQNLRYWQESGLKAWQLAGVQLLHGGISFLLCLILQNIWFIG
ncbi:MAG: hypothetical protein IJB69_01755 [Clostridia bacterium]|nr:hypothetical protein [Clostridia bacterium]